MHCLGFQQPALAAALGKETRFLGHYRCAVFSVTVEIPENCYFQGPRF